MYIKELIIENFRGFKDKTKIEFNGKINVLIGANNVGKTTIIKALELLFSYGTNKRLSIEDFNLNKTTTELKNNPPKITISAILCESNGEKEYSDDLITVSTWLINLDKPYKAMITFEFFLPEKHIKEYKTEMAKVDTDDINVYWKEIKANFLQKYISKVYIGDPQFKNIIDNESLKSFDFQFLTAIRDVERDLFYGGNSQLKEIIDFFIDYDIKCDQSISDEEKKDKINDKRKNFSKLSKQTINDLQIRMKRGKKEILKYVNMVGASFEKQKPDFEGELQETELYSALKLIVEFETGIKIPVSKNGLGYNNLLFISLLLAKMQKNASKEYLGSNAKSYSILAFEEPEAHLHPNMQYKLLKFLSQNINKEVRQIFITTHSPNITAAVTLDSLIVLTKNDDQVTVSYPGKVFNLTVDEEKKQKQYIERFLDVTKADIFFAKKLIFVEGLTEQLLLPLFAEKEDYSLIDNHISIINVNGRYFEPFINLFNIAKNKNAINKRVVCITDRDPGKKTDEETTFSKCYAIEEKLKRSGFKYSECTNSSYNYLKNLNCDNIKVFTQYKCSTFEEEFIFENYNLDFLIPECCNNASHLKSMMMEINEKITPMDLKKFYGPIQKNTELYNIIFESIENSKADLSDFEKAKYIISARYLQSLKKGQNAQNLLPILIEHSQEYNVPNYIKESLKWLCE